MIRGADNRVWNSTRIIIGAVLAVFLGGTSFQTSASAGPQPSPTTDSTSAQASRGSASSPARQHWTAQDILRGNPNAHEINPNVIKVAAGIYVLLPNPKPANAEGSTVSPSAVDPITLCQYLYLCFWEDAFLDGFGAGVALTARQGTNGFIDLGHYTYPNFSYSPSGAGAMWNDRISSYVNHQSNGTLAYFLNYFTGSGWGRIRNSTAPDYHGNLASISINDIIDGVHICYRHVADHGLVQDRGFVEEPLDEVAADASTLVVRVDFDARQVDFGWSKVDGQRPGVVSLDCDDLGVGVVEAALVKVALGGFVPAPDRRDIPAHRGAVQPVAEPVVRRRSRS
jgi:hypothetical protein